MEDELKIIFSDIAQREYDAVQGIKNDIERLKTRSTKMGGLSEPDAAELKRLTEVYGALDKDSYADPLFASVKTSFIGENGDIMPVVINHDGNGELSVGTAQTAEANQVVRVALTLGYLQTAHAPLPRLKKTKDGTGPDKDDVNWPKFSEAFFRALGRVAGQTQLAVKTLRILATEGDTKGDKRHPVVSTLEFARVMDLLIGRGVKASEPQLSRRVNEALDRAQNIGEDRPLHEIGIILPDLESTTDYEVAEDNIRLMAPMIFASMFEELKAFQVLDKMIEMSQRGELTLSRGVAGTKLYKYWREAPNRMSESERQTFYALTLGLPGGPVGTNVNSDFQDLWVRFVSSVSSLIRENRVDALLRSSLPVSINQQQVKKAARDLAANLSLHGYGMSYYAAIDLQTQINEMIDLFSDSEIKASFGAKDMWGVIDQIAQTELGGARNSSKYRTLATCGAIIVTWLANHASRLRDPTMPIIDLKEVENPPARGAGQTATSNPTDYDLVNACELWLADTALGDDQVEHLSQPRESPQQTSRPIQIPSIARDLLEGAGLGLGMSANGYGQSNGNGGYRAY